MNKLFYGEVKRKMGLEFHQTVYGKRFFELQLPSLIKAIERLASAVEKQNEKEGNKNAQAED